MTVHADPDIAQGAVPRAGLRLADLPELVTVDVAAEWLGVSRQTVYRLLDLDEITGVKLALRPGGRRIIRIKTSSLADLT
ncbi:helix-turn-helix domain-containing protein [bacterium]|nr:helix-turn-helix domain-containing protein [bacterium]